MIDTQNKTTTLYSYQNGIGANTEAILTRTLRRILYGDLYDDGGNGGNGGDEHWDNVVALLHFDGNLTDETGRSWEKQGAEANTSYVGGVFGQGIRKNGGDARYKSIVTLNSDEPITIEFNIRFNSSGLVSCGDFGGWQPHSYNGSFYFYVNGWDYDFGAISTGKFYHMAFSFDGTNAKLFKDGILQKTMRLYYIGGTKEFYLLGNWDGSNSDDITMDELRITKGVARYTENFTPPDAPFPSY